MGNGTGYRPYSRKYSPPGFSTDMTISEEKNFPICPYCNKRMALYYRGRKRIDMMNVLREKLAFVATKNSMFDLIKLKRELKTSAISIFLL